jgi:hypothetical protein
MEENEECFELLSTDFCFRLWIYGNQFLIINLMI